MEKSTKRTSCDGNKCIFIWREIYPEFEFRIYISTIEGICEIDEKFQKINKSFIHHFYFGAL